MSNLATAASFEAAIGEGLALLGGGSARGADFAATLFPLELQNLSNVSTAEWKGAFAFGMTSLWG